MKRFGLLLLGMGIALALSLTSINLDLLMSCLLYTSDAADD